MIRTQHHLKIATKGIWHVHRSNRKIMDDICQKQKLGEWARESDLLLPATFSSPLQNKQFFNRTWLTGDCSLRVSVLEYVRVSWRDRTDIKWALFTQKACSIWFGSPSVGIMSVMQYLVLCEKIRHTLLQTTIAFVPTYTSHLSSLPLQHKTNF